ncbi:hypothetical protein BB560_006636 [Smittium megazygosporum]|uniref:Protein YIF1 n=1 Tax=Smittium megazygosporum TaxID=133381 RepID=A0A2T9Y2P5_9FUNG|nr:hypothetical protein BB560_006636 [Smittium megazygosporum]
MQGQGFNPDLGNNQFSHNMQNQYPNPGPYQYQQGAPNAQPHGYNSHPSQFQQAPQNFGAQSGFQGHQVGSQSHFQPQQPNPQPQNSQFNPYEMLGIPNLEQNPAAQLGVQFAGSAMNSMHENAGKVFVNVLNLKLLKKYFDVTNGYVLQKLKIMFLPWFHKRWYRLIDRDANGQPVGFKSPREDSNANDLYIPLMGLITFTTCVGILAGLEEK